MKPANDTALGRRIEPIFAAFGRPGSPGCAVGVQRGGELLWCSGFGLANVEHGVPAAADTVFRIASVSKQFTVTAVLMLEAQGRLALGDDVRTLLPELGPLPQPVTVDQLMQNTSGLPDFLELLRLGGVGLDAMVDRAAMFEAIVRNRHLNFTPGSRFLYCNSNFLLLGLLVERIAGCSLGEFLRRHVFEPLGMSRTAMVVAADTPVPHLATPYLNAADGTLRRATHGFEHGGEGGLVSNVPDLLRWAAELLQPKLLPRTLAARLAEPTVLSSGHPSPYSRGLEHSLLDGRPCVGHGGLWPGYKTELLLIPDEQLAVAVISNASASNPYRLAREVASAVLEPQRRAAQPQAGIDALSGTWISRDTPALFELAVAGGELCVTQWGVPFVLEPQGDGSWLPWRGAYEFRLRVVDSQTLSVDVGAGQVVLFSRLAERAPIDPALAGDYANADTGARWRITAGAAQAQVSGPWATGGRPWRICGVTNDLVELVTPSPWLTVSQLAQAERDAAGHIAALRVCTSRIRGMRFVRV